METLNIDMTAAEIGKITRNQAQENFITGDMLIDVRDMYLGDRNWLSTFRNKYPQLVGESSTKVLNLCLKASEAYTEEERQLNLPWCIYRYSLTHTNKPKAWVKKVHRNGWTFDQLAKEVRELKEPTVRSRSEVLPPDEICAVDVIGCSGSSIGILKVLIDYSKGNAIPMVHVDLTKKLFTPKEAKELEEKMNMCNTEVEKFLGAKCMLSGIDADSIEICAA